MILTSMIALGCAQQLQEIAYMNAEDPLSILYMLDQLGPGIPAPTGVTATPADGQISIAWTPADGITDYLIYKSDTPGVSLTNYDEAISPGSNPYIDTTVVNGTEYFYMVVSVSGEDRAGSSPASAIPSWGATGVYNSVIDRTWSLTGPYSVAFGGGGNIYICDTLADRIVQLNNLVYQDYVRTWGIHGSGNGNFNKPTFAITRMTDLYVVDQNNNRIQMFDTDGVYQAQYTGGGGKIFSLPVSMAFDASGNIYVVDQGNNRILVFDSTWVYQSQLGSGTAGSGNGDFNTPTGITFDGSGNIYVTDSGNNRVQKFNSTFVYQATWAGTYSGTAMNYPTGILLSGGYIFVADYNNSRVLKLDTSGSLQAVYGNSLDVILDHPMFISEDALNNLNVGDTGNNRIQKISSTGGLNEGTIGQAGNMHPLQMAIDSSNNIYVVSGQDNCVYKFDMNGDFRAQYGNHEGGSGDGQFTHPYGIATDSTYLYVTDSDNDRVQKWRISDGAFISSWGTTGSGDTNFNDPRGIVYTGSYLYVVDSGNYRVKKMDVNGASGTPVSWGSQGNSDGLFQAPCGIAADGLGKIYVTDSTRNNVQIFTTAGVFDSEWTTWSGGSFNQPDGIAGDGHGNIFVANTGANMIEKFSLSGVHILQWGGSGVLSSPYGIVINSSGYAYVSDANNRIQMFK